MTRYRVAVFMNRFGEWRDTRDEAVQDALIMRAARRDREDGRVYWKVGTRIEEQE